MKRCPNPKCEQENPQSWDSFTNNKTKKDGKHSWCKSCVRVNDRKRDQKRKHKLKPYAKYKKSQCEKCAFTAIHPCQLDVDHIDGDHNNNEISNLQTLCANCHRLKTQLNKNFLQKKK